MIFLGSFIFFVLGLHLGNNLNIITCIILILCFIFFGFIFKKKIYLLLIITIAGFLLTFIVKKIAYVESINGIYIVKKAEYNYVLVTNFFQTYYIKIKNNNLEIGDILSLKGSLKELRFSTYQEGFNFTSYLNSHSCFYEFEGKYIVNYSSILKIKAWQNNLLSSYSKQAQSMLGSLLFKDSLAELDSYYNYKKLGISHLLSTSSLHIAFFNSFLIDFLKNKKLKVYIPLVLSFIFYVFSSFNLSILRIFLVNIIYIISKRFGIKVDSLYSNLLIGLFILVFNPFYFLNIGFYYIYFIVFLFKISSSYLPKRMVFKKFFSRFLFFILIIPLSLFNNYGINPIMFILQFFLSFIFTFLFVINLLVFIPMIFKPILEILNASCFRLVSNLANMKLFLVSGEVHILVLIVMYLLVILAFFFYDYKFIRLKKVVLCMLVLLFGFHFFP